MFITTRSLLLCGAALCVIATPDFTGSARAADADQGVTGIETVVVTARRKEELAQKTPISVTALSSTALRQAGVHDLSDLSTVVPGVKLVESGDKNNTQYSIRGVTQGVIGNQQPSVVTYENEVPMSHWGASLPTYDVSSVQVLKGPQGTLFGRNATAGAVLVTTKQPTYDFGAYLDGTFGSYDWRQVDGAVNIPLIDNVAALRIAGELARRDGYTKDMTFPGQDFDNVNRNAFRVSLLLEPLPGLKNTTIYDYQESDENGSGSPPVPGAYEPGGVADTVGDGLYPSMGQASYDLPAIIARQAAAGPYKEWVTRPPMDKGRLTSVSNTTTYDLGGVTLKNIFGYRTVYFNQNSDVSGTDVPMIIAHTTTDLDQLSDEFQVAGSSFDDKLSWIAGVFYLQSRPNGPQRLAIQQFAYVGVPFNSLTYNPALPPLLAASGGGIGSSDYYHDTSRAVYGQITYDLSGISSALDGFKIDLGARYTADTQSVCDVAASPEGLPIVNENECLATVGAPPALLNGVTPINAASVARAKSDKLTWNAGLDYQVNDDVLLYAVERRGYRAGGLNTPEFANLLIPFQSFKPETVTDTEVGAKTEWSVWDRPGLFNIAAYSSHYDNFQIGITSGSNFNPDGDPAATAVLHIPSNTTFYANVGTATVQGVEAQVNFSPVDGLTLGGSASWIGRKIDSITLAPTALAFFGTVANAKVESAAHGFANSPPFAYNATLDYIIPFDPAVGEVVFHAKYAKTGPISLISFSAPSWDEVDLRIDWNGIYGSNLDAGFFVTNVGNTVAIVAPSFSDFGFGYAASIYNQPRMFGVELRYHLGGEE